MDRRWGLRLCSLARFIIWSIQPENVILQTDKFIAQLQFLNPTHISYFVRFSSIENNLHNYNWLKY